MRRFATILVSMMVAGLMAGLAHAERVPTEEEKAKIEQALREQGYITWENIEFEDGVWEVDNARVGSEAGMAGEKQYDLKVDPHTLLVLDRIED